MTGERSPLEQVEFARNLLAFLLVGAFIACLPLLMFKAMPEHNKEIITYMVGQMSGMATMALGFYFINKVGQDALDAKRAESTGKMAEAMTTAIQAGGDGAIAGAREVERAATERRQEIEEKAS